MLAVLLDQFEHRLFGSCLDPVQQNSELVVLCQHRMGPRIIAFDQTERPPSLPIFAAMVEGKFRPSRRFRKESIFSISSPFQLLGVDEPAKEPEELLAKA